MAVPFWCFFLYIGQKCGILILNLFQFRYFLLISKYILRVIIARFIILWMTVIYSLTKHLVPYLYKLQNVTNLPQTCDLGGGGAQSKSKEFLQLKWSRPSCPHYI